jgi:hypothetical protein
MEHSTPFAALSGVPKGFVLDLTAFARKCYVINYNYTVTVPDKFITHT